MLWGLGVIALQAALPAATLVFRGWGRQVCVLPASSVLN